MAIKRIYCAVDFSPGSTQGLLTAVRLARDREAELVVLHAWALPANTFGSDFVYPESVVEHLAEDAQQGLDAARSQALQLGATKVSSQLVRGAPWQQIVDAATADPACDLVVIGSHGRTALSRVLLGSVAEMVVRHAPCPVLTVRGDGEPRPFSHVLCPVDFSPWSRAAIDLATELASRDRAAITLLHVQEPSVAWGEVRPFDVYADVSSDATKTLQRWGRELAAKVTVPVHQKTRVGRAGAQLLAALDDDPTVDLVVMGSHGRTGITRLALGSVAEKTVRHARCSVAVTHLRG
ncbi:MAG: universal stress protein [Kofleriaceae bacterium]